MSKTAERIFNTVSNNAQSVINLVIILVVFVIEVIVRDGVFKCPCIAVGNSTIGSYDGVGTTAYGTMFFVVPSFAFLVLGILGNNMTLQLLMGRVCRKSQHDSGGVLRMCFRVLGRAVLGSLAWIIFAFLDGRYYECAKSNASCSDDENMKKEWFVQSQMIGFVLLLVLLCATLIGWMLARSCSRLTYDQNKFVTTYRETERTEMVALFEEHAKEKTKEYIDWFLKEEKNRKQADWETISNIPPVESQKFDGKSAVYTSLMQWNADNPKPDDPNKPINQDLADQIKRLVADQIGGMDSADMKKAQASQINKLVAEQMGQLVADQIDDQIKDKVASQIKQELTKKMKGIVSNPSITID